jgi:hypothetical protein
VRSSVTATPDAVCVTWSALCIPSASSHAIFHLATGVSIALLAVELAAFARQVGMGPKKPIVLALDWAGWHTSLTPRVPESLYLLFLLPSSPELQPTEHLLDSVATDQRRPHQPPFRLV